MHDEGRHPVIYVDGREAILAPKQLKRKHKEIIDVAKNDVTNGERDAPLSLPSPFYQVAPQDMLLFQRPDQLMAPEDHQSKKQRLARAQPLV